MTVSAARERFEERRQRVARAGFELCVRLGTEAVSIEDIARAAFVSRTNLYRMFPSKAHILLAQFEYAVAQLASEVQRLQQAGGTPERLWGLVTARMADLGVRYRPLVGTVGQGLMARHSPLPALLLPVLQAMRERGELRDGADLALLSRLLCDACLLSLMRGGQRSRDEVVRDWAERRELILGGVLRPRPAGL